MLFSQMCKALKLINLSSYYKSTIIDYNRACFACVKRLKNKLFKCFDDESTVILNFKYAIWSPVGTRARC